MKELIKGKGQILDYWNNNNSIHELVCFGPIQINQNNTIRIQFDEIVLSRNQKNQEILVQHLICETDKRKPQGNWTKVQGHQVC